MNVAICDDNAEEAHLILQMLDAYLLDHSELSLSYFVFGTAETLLDAAKSGKKFDLLLLDVLLPALSGIELAERLPASIRHAPVIFLTSSADFAIDAFRVRARGYLLKPLQKAAFWSMLDEQLGTQACATDVPLTIATDAAGTLLLPLSSVAYAECIMHRVCYHLTDGSALTSRTIREPFAAAVAPLIASGQFLQTHRSYVVNAACIVQLGEETAELWDGVSVPVSRLRLAGVRRQYMDFHAARRASQ